MFVILKESMQSFRNTDKNIIFLCFRIVLESVVFVCVFAKARGKDWIYFRHIWIKNLLDFRLVNQNAFL